jgi:rubrerythrin
MTGQTSISQSEVDSRYKKLKSEGQGGGYSLNPDIEFTKELVKGLLANEKRYGYMACPCRLSALPLPVWRCRVCGYLCARDDPPELCPICKAKKERFERFI